MIGRLRGIVAYKAPPWLVVDVNGVGYELEAPMSTFYDLPELGREVTLYTHYAQKEDSVSLYGFLREGERRLFRDVQKVSGIGAKIALAVLSGVTVEEFARMVQAGDITALTRIPGIGKKTAERLILELRDKLDLLAAVASPRSPEKPKSAFSAIEEDVISALLNFGSTRPAAEAAVVKARGEDDAFEPLFRRALKLVR